MKTNGVATDILQMGLITSMHGFQLYRLASKVHLEGRQDENFNPYCEKDGSPTNIAISKKKRVPSSRVFASASACCWVGTSRASTTRYAQPTGYWCLVYAPKLTQVRCDGHARIHSASEVEWCSCSWGEHSQLLLHSQCRAPIRGHNWCPNVSQSRLCLSIFNNHPSNLSPC